MAMPEQNLPVVAEINNYPETKFNRLFPCTLTELSPLHKVMVNLVQLDTQQLDGKGDVYKQGDGLALTKIGCLKLMTAANVIMEKSETIFPRACQRCMQVAASIRQAPQCGNCATKSDCGYQVSIMVPEPSGGYRRYTATKELNKANYKGQIEHMAAQCETKALLRALRAGLGIKGVYSATELAKPFAVAVVVLNTHDPDMKKALIESYANSRNALFAPRTSPQLTTTEVPALPPAGGGVVMEDGTVALPPDDGDDDLPPSDDEASSGQLNEEENNPLACIHCKAKVTQRIKKFSEDNFGGKCYCMNCQKLITQAGAQNVN